jgi:hypothetical protein
VTRVPKGKVPADLAAPKHCDRNKVKTFVCGWCANAARSVNPTHNHRHCTTALCACGAVEHRFGRDIADVMVKVTRLSLDEVYAAHGRKRRVLSDEHLAKLQAGRAKGVGA